MNTYFRNKTAMVTGAGSGIGRAIAADLVKAGARVALVARGKEALDKEAARLGEGNTLVCPADVTDQAQVKQAVQSIIEKFASIDILVNCAGVFKAERFLDLPTEQIEKMIAINYLGTVNCLKEVLPHMLRARFGHIVNLSSLAGKIPVPGAGGYCASKYAVGGLSNNIRQEFRNHNIHVLAVYPSFVNSPMAAEHIESVRNTPFYRTTSTFPPEKISAGIMQGMLKKKRELIFPRRAALMVALYGICPNLMDTLIGRLCGGWPEPD